MRQRLERLAETGKCLFHGSLYDNLSALLPNQAMNGDKPDGEPAVFASTHPDPAIFMALLGKRGIGGWSKRFSGEFGFYAHAEGLREARLDDVRGFVYVVPREPFEPYRGSQWRSKTFVKPLGFLAVSVSDLPEELTIVGA